MPPDGIFLDGDKRMLQPYDLSRGVQPDRKCLYDRIGGQFLLFQNKEEATAPKTVLVRGI